MTLRIVTPEELKTILEEHKKWRKDPTTGKRADLGHMDLTYADLSGVDLCGADLSDSKLRNADLSYADLSGAYLRSADLSCARIRHANLSGAYLRSADLSGANLSDADLSGTDLCYADLRNADLYRAVLEGANVDFSAWPLRCGSLDAKVDQQLAAQLMYHVLRVWPDARTDKACELANSWKGIEEHDLKEIKPKHGDVNETCS